MCKSSLTTTYIHILQYSSYFTLCVESEQADAGRDGRTRLAKPNSQARTGTGYSMCVCTYVCMVITYKQSTDQPGKVADFARGQLNRENEFFPVPVRA